MAAIKRLWVAEKPLVANALVKVLCKQERCTSKRENGYSLLSNGDAVVPLWGHMIEMARPGAYLEGIDPEKQKNYFNILPLIPKKFVFVAKKERTKEGKEVEGRQIKIVQRLTKQAKSIVNACDIDREGQLIFDELMEFFGLDPAAGQFDRVVINSLAEEDLSRSVRALEKNGSPKWVRVRQAAQTRQAMDWLLGMNASMAMQQLTGIRTMSVGRVQTPVLAMVVMRDLAIDNFRPQPFYVPIAQLENGAQVRWAKSEQATPGVPGFDDKGRMLDLTTAQAVLKRLQQGEQGVVKVCTTKTVEKAPPLPFSMATLQSFVARQYDLNVTEISAAAKTLYEQHQAITYIGTDCEYYPESLHGQASELVSLLRALMSHACEGVDTARKSAAFNDEKLDEHYALAPTTKIPDVSALTRAEAAVYEAICTRFIAQFHPPHVQTKCALEVHFGSEVFKASASEDVDLGWKSLYKSDVSEADEEDLPDTTETKVSNTVAVLSASDVGECVRAVGGKVHQGTTTAPERYTEGTLIEDMKNASKFARSDQERQMLRESTGIGTSRTRDVVIANLIQRQLLERKKKKGSRRDEIFSTALARQTVGRLPAWLTDVATTARWEMILSSIAKGEAPPDAALKMQEVYVTQVVDRIKAQQKIAA